MSNPYIFDEFFASGRDESISPFLTPKSRSWGKNLSLKSALFAALLLAVAFTLSFINPHASNLCLASVYFLVGTPALLNSFEDLRNFEINIDVLMTLAALLSVLIGSGIEGALLLVLFEFSAAMENMVTEKTKSALISLQRLSPKTAFVIESDGIVVEKSDPRSGHPHTHPDQSGRSGPSRWQSDRRQLVCQPRPSHRRNRVTGQTHRR